MERLEKMKQLQTALRDLGKKISEVETTIYRYQQRRMQLREQMHAWQGDLHRLQREELVAARQKHDPRFLAEQLRQHFTEDELREFVIAQRAACKVERLRPERPDGPAWEE